MTRPRAPASAPKLVVLRALGLGDLLTAVPALRALADAHRDHRRLLAAPRALAPLLPLIRTTGGAPAVHELADVAELRALPRVCAGATLAVNLHGRGPQSHRLLQATRPRETIAFANADAGADGPAWRAGEHEVERWCRLLRESGVAADPAQLEISPPPEAPPAQARAATVIHPGAASAARRWPAERFASVARAERERGRPVVVTGARDEVALARAIAGSAGLPPASVLAGETDLTGLVRVVAAADRVVCGDTGVGHLATALGTPSVLLFGPSRPAEWGPPAGRPRHRVLWSGSVGDPHGTRPDPGLLAIEAARVETELARLPARSDPPTESVVARGHPEETVL